MKSSSTTRGGGLGVPQRPKERLHATVELLQSKYEENLNVIHSIYNEKKDMEMKIRMLEAQLRSSQNGISGANSGGNNGSSGSGGGGYGQSANAGSKKVVDEYDYEREDDRGVNVINKYATLDHARSLNMRGTRSELDASPLLTENRSRQGNIKNIDIMKISHGDEGSPPVTSRSSQSLNGRSQTRVDAGRNNGKRGGLAMSASEIASSYDRETRSYTGTDNVRYSNGNNNFDDGIETRSMDLQRPRSASSNRNRSSTSSLGDYNTRRPRSASVGTYKSGRGISAELRASQTKYVQTVAMSRYAQEQERLKQVEYEKYLKERLHRAAKAAPFKNLTENVEAFVKHRKEDVEKKRRQRVEAEAAEIKAYKEKIREHINKPRDDLYSSKNWDEVKAAMQLRREENIRKNKEESTSKMKPFNFLSSTQERASKAKGTESEVTLKRTVTAKECIEAMKKRDDECNDRRLRREQRLKEEEELELAKRIEMERQKKERIDNMKLPPSSRRLTKAAEDKARIVSLTFTLVAHPCFTLRVSLGEGTD
jgi:hypothetical protein